MLTFVAAPDFELPSDAGNNNIYNVTVQVDDGTFTVIQALAVTVTNVNEAPTAIGLSDFVIVGYTPGDIAGMLTVALVAPVKVRERSPVGEPAPLTETEPEPGVAVN